MSSYTVTSSCRLINVCVDDEAMDIEEKWGDNDVIDMDVDMTEEEQLSLISEIHTTRNSHLPLAASVDSVTQQSAPSLTYTVSSLFVRVGRVRGQHHVQGLWNFNQSALLHGHGICNVSI